MLWVLMYNDDGMLPGSTSEGFLGDCCEIDADCNAQLALQCIDNTCQCLPGHVNINETCTLCKYAQEI